MFDSFRCRSVSFFRRTFTSFLRGPSSADHFRANAIYIHLDLIPPNPVFQHSIIPLPIVIRSGQSLSLSTRPKGSGFNLLIRTGRYVFINSKPIRDKYILLFFELVDIEAKLPDSLIQNGSISAGYVQRGGTV